jgi:hypothetical protein
VDRFARRKVAWLLFGLFLLGALIGVTASIVYMALQAGTAARVLAGVGWVVAFGASWRGFRRSHGGCQAPKPPVRRISQTRERWRLLLGVGVVGLLLSLNESVQMIGLALVSGFVWPAFYWITRSFVRRPELRQRLWSGQLRRLTAK